MSCKRCNRLGLDMWNLEKNFKKGKLSLRILAKASAIRSFCPLFLSFLSPSSSSSTCPCCVHVHDSSLFFFDLFLLGSHSRLTRRHINTRKSMRDLRNPLYFAPTRNESFDYGLDFSWLRVKVLHIYTESLRSIATTCTRNWSSCLPSMSSQLTQL